MKNSTIILVVSVKSFLINLMLAVRQNLIRTVFNKACFLVNVFSCVTSLEVYSYNIIILPNPNKSCGSDGIDVKYLRSADLAIAPVLALA